MSCRSFFVVACFIAPFFCSDRLPVRRSFSDGGTPVAYTQNAPAQVPLPDAPGKDETVRTCGTCHEVERATAVRLSRDGWQDTIAKMVDLGATGSDEELAKVLDYLAEHFKGDAPRPLNLNTATAIELESIVGLLRKEAAAWIAHRKAAGSCKSLDDFKKIPGVPFKKIDDRRDRLVCF